ncbi:unnamed protein product [Adineta ricciae]|uniref:Poly [ADP-ribose] polymerase n=1 Tax=Adineta ricciae TaxID=249248 RepID=A0A814DZ20_ADIRI|nr:unnamed protein product [Adineta ricciae]
MDYTSSDESDGNVLANKKKLKSTTKRNASGEAQMKNGLMKPSMKKKVSSMTKTSQRESVQPDQNRKGLNGKYWADTLSKRVVNSKHTDEDSSSDDTSSTSTLSEESGSTASVSSSDDDNDVLYEKHSFVTCRGATNTFYLCQILKNVYENTKKIPIRWCSVIGEDGDNTKISTKTQFKLSYTDTLDPAAILLGVSSVIEHSGGVFSLKKQDIVDSSRLLQKSIRGESLSSDDMMDLSTEHPPPPKSKKATKHIRFNSDEDQNSSSSSSEASKTEVPVSKKRKLGSANKKSRKQPPKKRTRKTSDGSDDTTTKRKPRRKKNVPDDDDDEEHDDEMDTSTIKKKTKPARTPKVQLFKVHSNSSLTKNPTVTVFKAEPFFEDNLPVPFISSYVQSKLAIRAVNLNDAKLLKSLINDTNHVCSVHVHRSLFTDLTAVHYAIKSNNIELVKILLDDIKSPKKTRCPFPTISMVRQSTGNVNTHAFGFRTMKLMASRGAKEGNDALNKDSMSAESFHNVRELVSFALQNNCSREMYDFLIKTHKDSLRLESIYDNIYKIIVAGHRKLAASIVGDVKENTFHGFNALHHQVLLYDNEDITINRVASVVKKTRENSMITPIHCAAINPNSKYLKQLLNAMPEYNILDRYDRRPIHFAAACESSEPLEFLLSKHVNMNDVDRGGNSPLHIAAMHGRAHNVELLLRTAKEKSEGNEDENEVQEKFGLACINRMNKSRFYPLHLAVLNNHLDCAKTLLDYDAPINVITSAAQKITPLMLACQKGYLEIVQYLISKGAVVEARDRFQRTPLIHACMCGNANVVSYLLHIGADPNVFDSSMNTALHYAIAYGWYFCVKVLLEAGANLNCINCWQTTCLAIGFLKGHYGLCDYLLTEHNADINFTTDDGLSLVMLTVSQEISTSIVEQLEYVVEKHKADCTIVDTNGSNAFHYLAGNLCNQNSTYLDEASKKTLHENYFKVAQILLDHNCEPDKLNSKLQSPLMIALETGNFILVNYLIDKAKVSINADTSYNGKTLLHYFAQKCARFDLMQVLLKLPVTDEVRKMGQIYDNNGRTPLHYCASIFDRFCSKFKLSKGTEKLEKRYQSIVRMIEYCLQSAECDPDAGVKSIDQVKKSDNEENIEDDDDNVDEPAEENEEDHNESSSSSNEENADEDQTEKETDVEDESSDVKLKETSIFSLLRTVRFIDQSITHPLETFLKKSNKVNVLHHETHRTPLLEAIHLREVQTAQMLIKHPSCDVNLAASKYSREQQQTPLISACRLQLSPTIRSLLEHNKCQILSSDSNNNQAFHYYLRTSNRINDYIELLNLFVKRLTESTKNAMNIPGKHQRTPLHIAVYYNLGTIDAITNIEKILIENGSDLMLKDDLGNIPLHNVFLNKDIGDDPVELCVLLLKAMKSKGIDTKNNEGNTPLHLAVEKCSTVCVMLLQEHQASLLIKNNLSNSIIGTCIASEHLNLFITFLQQSMDIDLSTMHKVHVEKPDTNEEKPSSSLGTVVKPVTHRERKSKENSSIWKWQYSQIGKNEEYKSYSLMYLIIQSDWQGALSLVLNDISRFHLTYIQIIETAIANDKLNLVLRLLLRLKDEKYSPTLNSSKQNLFHLIANTKPSNEYLLKQILAALIEYKFNWNTPDIHGSYPLHYACVQQNFIVLNCLREHFPRAFNLQQTDGFNNTASGLLFWSIREKTTLTKDELQGLIKSGKQLDCLCNYDNEIARNPLSFGHVPSENNESAYPPIRTSQMRTSPLIHAIVHNNFELVKFLLELNADVNFADEDKQTPLMHAVRKNDIDLVKLLLNKTHSIETTESSNERVVRTRRKAFAPKPRRLNFHFGAKIHRATNHSDKASANKKSKEFQMTSKIDLNALDKNGRSCIHHLIQPFTRGSYRNNLEILRLLHSCGATLTVADRSGLTPLQYSTQNHYQHLYEELSKLVHNKPASIRSLANTFTVVDPNKNLLGDKPDFYRDAQKLIDDYISTHTASTHNAAYQVDRASGMSLIGTVLIDADKNEPYDVRLTKIDVNYGRYGLYNFYRMQIIVHKSKSNLYFLFTHWGRIGDAEGQHQLTPFSTLDECRKEFLKVFREKTGNAWKDTDQFVPKAKKYTLVKLSDREIKKHSTVQIDFHRLQAENQHPPTKIQSSAHETLMRTLISREAMRTNLHKTQLDVEWMPVSQLKREALERARDLLIKIKEKLDEQEKLNKDNPTNKTADQKHELQQILEAIYQYTNEYYTLVPLNGYSDEKLPILNDEQQLKQQEKMLDDLFDLELTYKILLGAQANLKSISPLDYLYKSINCQFETMNQNDQDSQLILRYIWASSPQIDVEQIFKIARPKEDERLRKRNVNNHFLLWHGTNICNLISILSRGLLVGPLVATATGSLFGTGIYTADVFAKSLGYCSGVKDKDQERCFMLLCEVALGNMKEVGIQKIQSNNEDEDENEEDEEEKEEEEEEDEEEEEEDDDDVNDVRLDLKKYQSRKGVGRNIPDPKHTIVRDDGVQIPLGRLIPNKQASQGYYGLNYNEYIVYDEAQVALRYLVQFRR